MAEPAPLIPVLDDDEDFLIITRSVPQGGGYGVASAFGPEEALARMAEERPQLIIADLMLRAAGGEAW